MMIGLRTGLLAGAIGLMAVVAGVAQESHEGMDHGEINHGEMHQGGMDHGGMEHAAMRDGPMGRMMGAMDGMMQAMPGASTGSVDADFLAMMIPHHQSAIDMARVELESGTDPETRALAQEIIDAQEAEIAQMRGMLARLGVETPGAD